MQKEMDLSHHFQDQEFIYQTFYETLSGKLQDDEITSLNVLGKEFFVLVDQMAAELFVERAGDSLMLGLSLQDYLWELQVFANQFLRNSAGSVLKLKGFCESLIKCLHDLGFRDQFNAELRSAYENHFFVTESHGAYLV